LELSRKEIKAERWLPIQGKNREHYDVSDMGRVRSWRTSGTHYTGILREEPYMKKLSTCCGGYLKVGMGKYDNALVRTLVLETFVGPRPERMLATCELDSVTECRLKYLSWSYPDMASRANGKLVDSEILEIMDMIYECVPAKIIADIYYVTPMTINRIKRGESHTRLTR